jgi:hypothetical protein
MKIFATMLLVLSLSGCSSLAGMAMDAVTGGSSGGINTDVELVVGDKNQNIGDNTKIDIEAEKVEKVVGKDDNSVTLDGEVENVEVVTNNTNFPTWMLVSLIISNMVFLWLPAIPTPTWAGFKKLIGRGK